MADVATCDRCGREWDPNGARTEQRMGVHLVVEGYGCATMLYTDDGDLDLCPTCNLVFADWIATGPRQPIPRSGLR